MNNTGNGYFQLSDSLKVEYGVFNILGDFFDNNSFIDIYTRLQTTDPYTENILIIYNFGDTKFDNIKQFYLYNGAPINGYSNGDINNNNSEDIVFICNNDFLWGIIYNDGTGNFSSPEYFTLDFPPTDIECADLNDDGRSDIVVTGGSKTEIYFSTETGFNQQLLTETLYLYVLISDFDNDNDNDIILHTTYYANHHRAYFFENLGNNEFFEHDHFDFTPFCSYAQIADFNNDSLPDMVFIADNHSGLYIYNNIGDFTIEYQQFIPHQRTNPQGLFCEDYDNNGFIDIAFTSGVGGIDYYLNILFNDGKGNFVEDPVGIIEKEDKQKNILSCYPNPFTDKTTISINTNNNEKIKLEIYDIQGKLIRTFIDDKPYTGVYKIIWNGDDLNGKEVLAGIYFACITANGKVIQSIKLIKK
jgi:hypothetical protein